MPTEDNEKKATGESTAKTPKSRRSSTRNSASTTTSTTPPPTDGSEARESRTPTERSDTEPSRSPEVHSPLHAAAATGVLPSTPSTEDQSSEDSREWNPGEEHAGAGTHTDQTTPDQDPAGDRNPRESRVINHPDSPLNPDEDGSLPASFRQDSAASSPSNEGGLSRSPLESAGFIPRTAPNPGEGRTVPLERPGSSSIEQDEFQRLLEAATANPHLVTDALERAERREANDRNIAKMDERLVARNELLAKGASGQVFDSPVEQRRALEK